MRTYACGCARAFACAGCVRVRWRGVGEGGSGVGGVAYVCGGGL